MIEPHFSEQDFAVEQHPKEDWEPIGKKIFWGNAVIAGTAFVSALAKKKRVYTVYVPAGEAVQPAQPIEAGEVEDQIPEVLKCEPLVKEKIIRLWTQIADGYLTPNLWVLGNEIEDQHQVHPLALFIHLPREKLQKIFNSDEFFYKLARIPTIMWGFNKGMRKAISMERPHTWPELGTLLPSFAEQMRKDEGEIRRLIQAAEWRGLVHYLYDIQA